MREVINLVKQSAFVCFNNMKAVITVQLLDLLRSVLYIYLLLQFTDSTINMEESADLADLVHANSKTQPLILIVLVFLEAFVAAIVRSLQTGVIILNNKDPLFIQKLLNFVKTNLFNLAQLYFVISLFYGIGIFIFTPITIFIAIACVFSDFFVIFNKSSVFHSIYCSFYFVRQHLAFILKFGLLFFVSILCVQFFLFSKILVLIIMHMIYIVTRTALMLFFLKNVSK